MTDGSHPPIPRPPLASGIADRAVADLNRLWTIARAFTNVAHDLNNVLMVISGSAEMLEARALEPDVRRRVDAIRDEATRAAAVIERLLTYVRSEPQTPQPDDVEAVVQSAIALRRASAARSRISLRVTGVNGQARASFDRARTLQALLDLLLNAEASVAGRRDAVIGVDVADRPDQIVVRITAEGGEPASDPGAPRPLSSGESAAVTSGAAEWTAAYLLASQGGSLAATATTRGQMWTLTFPKT